MREGRLQVAAITGSVLLLGFAVVLYRSTSAAPPALNVHAPAISEITTSASSSTATTAATTTTTATSDTATSATAPQQAPVAVSVSTTAAVAPVTSSTTSAVTVAQPSSSTDTSSTTTDTVAQPTPTPVTVTYFSRKGTGNQTTPSFSVPAGMTGTVDFEGPTYARCNLVASTGQISWQCPIGPTSYTFPSSPSWHFIITATAGTYSGSWSVTVTGPAQ